MPDNKYHILVADDEDNILELLELYLLNEGFQVSRARDGRETLQKMEEIKPDLLLLDIMMPYIDGREVCNELRRRGDKTPIVMLTARGDDYDVIHGLDLGADDYITKPFNPREVVARAKAVLRRLHNEEAGGAAQKKVYPGLEIDLDQYVVLVEGKQVDLTRKEINLLWLLAGHPNRVFTRENLLEAVWGYEYPEGPRTVDTHIKRLRQKLAGGKDRVHNAEQDDIKQAGEDSTGSKNHRPNWWIKTIWGVGYKFEVES